MKDVDIKRFIFGLIFVLVIVKILKRIIKQKRPKQERYLDYGMPSSRAAFVSFIATYLILITKNLSDISKLLLIFFVFISCYMKYYLEEHSMSQLLVGCLIGYIIGKVFYNLNINGT